MKYFRKLPLLHSFSTCCGGYYPTFEYWKILVVILFVNILRITWWLELRWKLSFLIGRNSLTRNVLPIFRFGYYSTSFSPGQTYLLGKGSTICWLMIKSPTEKMLSTLAMSLLSLECINRISHSRHKKENLCLCTHKSQTYIACPYISWLANAAYQAVHHLASEVRLSFIIEGCSSIIFNAELGCK